MNQRGQERRTNTLYLQNPHQLNSVGKISFYIDTLTGGGCFFTEYPYHLTLL